MKFSVNKFFILLVFGLVTFAIVLSQPQSPSFCECVDCPPDEIAVCKYDTGKCKGKCVRLTRDEKNQVDPKLVVADLLTAALDREISTNDLDKAPKEYLRILERLLDSKGKAVEIEFEGKTTKVGIDLRGDAKDSFTAVRKQLKDPK